ncbi:MAG: peptidoglycan DD-metalloendopeptidase family protein [Acidobacteriota bacterium]|nr:peptidoglycan DD-metalloendopeptidase family protein [Acidobacteriota bacterium]
MIKAHYQLPLLLLSIALLAVGLVVLSGYGAWKYVTREDSSTEIRWSEPAQDAAPAAETTPSSPAGSAVERSGPRQAVAVPAAQRQRLAQESETPSSSPARRSDVPPDTATAALELAQRQLLIPVRGIEPDELWDTYPDPRSGGRVHQALDIMAPRGTPVLAADDGQVAQLLSSKLGGISLYLYDASQSYCFYYAHLDRYADGLEEGDTIRRGDVLGYVGSTGNAPNHAPHLHFSIHIRNEEGRCWRSETVNPFPILRYAGVGAK